MAKKSSQNKTIHISIKQGSAVIFIAALLILGANWLLNQRGETLPAEMTNAAATVVSQSLTGTVPAEAPEMEAELEGETAVSLPIPPPASSELPWAGADGDFDYYVLALSWQPAFCETASRKPECASQTGERYDAANFVLHGLWPNQADDPSHSFAYCAQPAAVIDTDKEGDWCDLPDPALSAAVENDLNTFMPGTASCLDRHEWTKHGTCAGMDADAYFGLSNGLAALFAQSDFNHYVADNIGREVSRNDLLARFEAEFGPGAADFLSLRCSDVGGQSLLSEIRIVLKQDLAELTHFADLFPAESVRPDGRCPQWFMIDEAG
jgi:ribonuclease T2